MDKTKASRSQLGMMLSGIYFGIFVFTCIIAIITFAVDPDNSEFAGVFTLIVTLPWTALLSPLFDAVGYIAWYDQFSDIALLYGLFALSIMLPGAMINLIIFYYCGALIDRMRRKN